MKGKKRAICCFFFPLGERKRRDMNKEKLFRNLSEDPGFKTKGPGGLKLKIDFLYASRSPPNYRNLWKFKWIEGLDEFCKASDFAFIFTEMYLHIHIYIHIHKHTHLLMHTLDKL